MTKIIVEHVTKRPKVKLNVFVDGAKVGQINNHTPLEVDVNAGDRLLHIGFGSKKIEGVGVPIQLAEGETKKVRTGLTASALFAARWHFFLLVFAFGMVSLLISNLLFSGVALATVFVPIAIPVYFLVKMQRAKNPKNFVEIEVME